MKYSILNAGFIGCIAHLCLWTSILASEPATSPDYPKLECYLAQLHSDSESFGGMCIVESNRQLSPFLEISIKHTELGPSGQLLKTTEHGK